MRVTPYKALFAALLMTLVATFISTQYVVHQPWLGLYLGPVKTGLLVKEVHSLGPSLNHLSVGDVLVEITGADGNRMKLQAQDIIEDPDSISTFRERDAFRERQSKIYQILSQPLVVFSLDTGAVVEVAPMPSRPILSLSWSYWLLTFYSITALVVGASIWSLKPSTLPARYLLLSGIGAVLLLNAVKVFALRELALDGQDFQWLTLVYHLGDDAFSFGTIALLWNYPKRLGDNRVLNILVVYMMFFILNENFAWFELPGNSVLIQVPLYIFLGFVFLVIQWKKSKGNPTDRAIIKVLILNISIVTFSLAGTYLSSVFHLDVPYLGLNNSFFAMFVMYVVLSLSVVRYRLFDIEHWWFEVWLWFFAGLLIVFIDMGVVALFNFNSAYAMIGTLLFVSWFYFPLRQWVWGKFFLRPKQVLEDYAPLIIEQFMRVDYPDRIKLWEQVLRDVFQPLACEVRRQTVTKSRISSDGLSMFVPCMGEDCCLELQYPDKSTRLFNGSDITLSQALFEITKRSIEKRDVYIQKLRDERKRMMRDLHDDVGSKLLTLTHAQHNTSHVAAEALKSLREIIYCLDVDQEITLNSAVAQWRLEALERCELANISFCWLWVELEKDIEISPRLFLNLTLILRESLSNIVKHAQPNTATFDLRVCDGELHLRIKNNGLKPSAQKLKLGKGLNNMRYRVEELSGRFGYQRLDSEFIIELSLPLHQRGAYA